MYHLGHLACGGVNSANNIYFRNGVTPKNPAGSSWTKVPGKNNDKLEACSKYY